MTKIVQPNSTNFKDNDFNIVDNLDSTKKINFEASSIATGTTRTLTVQNQSGVIPLQSNITLSNKIIPYINSSGQLTQNASRLIWDNAAEAMGVGSNAPAATLHVNTTLNRTATPPNGLSATAILETLISAPSNSNLIATIIDDVPQLCSILSIVQNLSGGNLVANGQTINYTAWAYKVLSDGTFYTQSFSGSFTDLINDGITVFSLDILLDGLNLDGFIISTNSGSTTVDINSFGTISVTDDGLAFSQGTSTSEPSNNFVFQSTNINLNYRARFLALSPFNTNYFSPEFDFIISEPIAGTNYLVKFESINLSGNTLYIYGADNGSTSFQGAGIFNADNQIKYATYLSWQFGNDWIAGGVTTQTPTNYAFIIGSGQTLKYKAKTRIIESGYNYYYSTAYSNEASIVVPNTAQRYYVQLSSINPGTTNTPLTGLNNYCAYKIFKAAPTAYNTAINTANTTVLNNLNYIDDGQTWGGVLDDTPTSYIPSAARFASGAFGDPSSPTAGYSLQAVFQSLSSSSPTAGFEMVASDGNRLGLTYANGNSFYQKFASNFYWQTFAGFQLMQMSTSGIEFGTTLTTLTSKFKGNASTSDLLTVSQPNLSVSLGQAGALGALLSIYNPISKASNPIIDIKQLGGVVTGDIVNARNSSNAEIFKINSVGNLTCGTITSGAINLAGTTNVGMLVATGNLTAKNINTVVLTADVTNNNAVANTLQNVTGLSFPVVSGGQYHFRAWIAYTSAATTTGSRWTINTPTTSHLGYESQYTLTATTQVLNCGLSAKQNPNNSSASSLTVGNRAIIEGILTASANGTVDIQFASEVALSAIVAKAGSILTWEKLN